MEILKLLKKLNINYELLEHKAVFTSEEASFIKEQIEGLGVKNLFLKDTKKNYYLLLREDTKPVDLKKIQEKVGTSRLSFGNEEELKNIMNLTKGSVSPLGIINDKNNLITIIIDNELKDKKLLVHPLINTCTISIKYEDLIKIIEHEKHNYIKINIWKNNKRKSHLSDLNQTLNI